MTYQPPLIGTWENYAPVRPQVVGLLSYAVQPTPGHDLASKYAEARRLINGARTRIIWRIDYRPGQSVPATDHDLDLFLAALTAWRSLQPEASMGYLEQGYIVVSMGNEPNLKAEGGLPPGAVARALNGRKGADFLSLMRSNGWGGPACRVAVPAVAAYGSDVPLGGDRWGQSLDNLRSPWAGYACLLYEAIFDCPNAQPSDILLHVYSRVGDGGQTQAAEPWTPAFESHGYPWSSGELLTEWKDQLDIVRSYYKVTSEPPRIWITEYNPFADRILPDAAYPDGLLTAMRDRAVNILGERFGGLLWFIGDAQAPWEAYSLETQTRAAAELKRLTAL